MDHEIKLCISIIRKACSNIRRDFFEIETLQHRPLSSRKHFVFQALDFLLKNIVKSLSSKLSYDFVVVYNNKSLENKFKNFNKKSKLIIINIDDIEQYLLHALPFFCLSFTQLTHDLVHGTEYKGIKFKTDYTIMYFPILDELYYTIADKGTFIERGNLQNYSTYRARIRECFTDLNDNNFEDVVAIFDKYHSDYNKLYEILPQTFIYGSASYCASLLCCGKSDIAIFKYNDLLYPSIKLLVSESGGIVTMYKDFIIISNYMLSKSVVSILDKL